MAADALDEYIRESISVAAKRPDCVVLSGLKPSDHLRQGPLGSFVEPRDFMTALKETQGAADALDTVARLVEACAMELPFDESILARPAALPAGPARGVSSASARGTPLKAGAGAGTGAGPEDRGELQPEDVWENVLSEEASEGFSIGGGLATSQSWGACWDGGTTAPQHRGGGGSSAVHSGEGLPRSGEAHSSMVRPPIQAWCHARTGCPPSAALERITLRATSQKVGSFL